ncbi:MAG TPA: GntR family transcriptional regulator [Castellaniella sp.]|uniref:GntR family transcriptional regulator n=1 Tax=Castellaniella sp. TaxID=1955812 RepID=UPI002EF8F759
MSQDQTFGRIADVSGYRLHEAVRRKLSEAIAAGRWAPGDVLPSEVVLADDFGVSVGTVRKALSTLTAEGVVMRRRKTGTVVTGWAQLHNMSHFYQYFRLHDKEGHLLRSHAKLFLHEVADSDATEREQLRLASGAQVLRLHRVRYIDEHPAMLDQFTLPLALIPGFPAKDHVPELLYQFLFQHYDLRIAAIRESVTAGLADEHVARHLQLTRPAAVLMLEEVAFDQMVTPVIWSRHFADTTEFRYINEIR